MIREDTPVQGVHQRLEIGAATGRRLKEERVDVATTETGDHRLAPQRPEVISDDVRDAMREAPHRRLIEIQRDSSGHADG